MKKADKESKRGTNLLKKLAVAKKFHFRPNIIPDLQGFDPCKQKLILPWPCGTGKAVIPFQKAKIIAAEGQ